MGNILFAFRKYCGNWIEFLAAEVGICQFLNQLGVSNLMHDIRYALRNGDITSANGRLIAVGHTMIHHGVMVGVEGDYATCPACNDGGPVMNDCYPAFDIMGKQILVSGARVYCQCAIKPRVFHSQTDFSIEVTRSGRGAGSTYGDCDSNTLDESEEILEQFLEIVNLDNGEKVHRQRYDLYVNGEVVAADEKMIDGRTRSVRGPCEVYAEIWHDWSNA